MTRSRVLRLAAAALALVAALAYLRDPAWLISVESGFRPWERDREGVACRWMGGHASFFVPTSAAAITLPVRTTFAGPADPPVTVSVSLDGRPADRLTLTTGDWHRIELRMPGPNGRRVRRVDIQADRSRSGNRSVQLGVVEIE